MSARRARRQLYTANVDVRCNMSDKTYLDMSGAGERREL